LPFAVPVAVWQFRRVPRISGAAFTLDYYFNPLHYFIATEHTLTLNIIYHPRLASEFDMC
jgi:hypothetical protein